MGTSLKVFGLQKIVREFAKAVHSHKNGKGRVIFVNRTRPAESVWEGIIDDFVAMDCDDWVEDLKSRRHDLWFRQGEIDMTVTKSAQPKRKRKSIEDDNAKEKRPTKKAKIVVEVPSRDAAAGQNTSDMLARRLQSPKKIKLPQDYPGRAILSPLAQARRPSVSPFTSPIRGDDESHLHSSRKRGTPVRPPISPFSSPIFADTMREPSASRKWGTPKRPEFSPFTPGVRTGSKLKMEVCRDENNFFPPSPYMSDAEPEAGPDEDSAAMTATEQLGEVNDSKHSQFMAQVWQRVRDSGIFLYGQKPHSSQELIDDDVDGVETPSRGPRGRKIDVFAE
jgi:hypothetical protein